MRFVLTVFVLAASASAFAQNVRQTVKQTTGQFLTAEREVLENYDFDANAAFEIEFRNTVDESVRREAQDK